MDFLLSEFTTRYLRPTRKRPEYAESILARDALPPWKGPDARTIEPHEAIELLDGITGRGSRVMANRTAALLGQLFKFAIQRRILRTTPVQRDDKRQVESIYDRTRDEIARKTGHLPLGTFDRDLAKLEGTQRL